LALCITAMGKIRPNFDCLNQSKGKPMAPVFSPSKGGNEFNRRCFVTQAALLGRKSA